MAASQHDELLKEGPFPSNDKPQLVSSRPTLFARYVQDWWLLELLSILLGIVAIIALFILLKEYDGNPAPQANAVVGVKITLNTLVSILSTIGRLALLLPVSAAISQSKWTWYLKMDRPLEDLETFDQASRGPWGGLQLLWRIKFRQSASLGAILVVAALAVDPLSQQLVHYRVRMVRGVDGSAMLPAAVNWTDGSQDTSTFGGGSNSNDDTPEPPLPMKAVIQNGLYSQMTDIVDLEPPCSSGNCTWPSYRSLAICARTADVTSHLRTRPISVPNDEPGAPPLKIKRWFLSDQNFITGTSTIFSNMSSAARRQDLLGKTSQVVRPFALDFTDSIAFKDSALPIADVFMIYSNTTTIDGDHPATFSAVEFVLDWCVQNFTTLIANGVSSTKRHDVFRDFSKPDPDEPSAVLGARPNDGDRRYYFIDRTTHYSLQKYFQGLIHGSVDSTQNSGAARLAVTNDVTQALYNPFDLSGRKINGENQVPGRNVGLEGLQRILDNTATGMTNAIRTHYNQTATAGTVAEQIQGSANHLETYVEIQWGWITAPITLLVGTLVFFFAAFTSSSDFGRRPKPGIWKSSSLPLLKALNDELHKEAFSGMRTTSGMEDWARDIPVRLMRDVDGDGWKLVRSGYQDRKSESMEMRSLNG